jgi:hypothetical protein
MFVRQGKGVATLQHPNRPKGATDMRSLPDSIGSVYEHHGPFVTAYFDATRTSENGSHEVELRWQELRRSLAGEGAGEEDLTALDETLAEHLDVGGRHGKVVVAADGEVVLDEVMPQPPARPRASLGALPDLMPMLAARPAGIPYVLVVADHTGADLVSVPAELAAAGIRPGAMAVAGSRPYPIHKTGRNEWDERHFQNRVDNSWATNARDVAAQVQRQVESIGAELVILAGDPRARSLLREDLPRVLDAATVETVEAEAGARAAGASDDPLEAAVRDALLQFSWRRRRDVLEHLQQNLGRERFAVAGVPGVVGAVRRSQADTVVISDDPSSTLRAWIGPEPLQLGLSADELSAMGVEQPRQVRFDAALLRAVVGSGADMLVTPNAHDYVDGGIAALLRYDETPPRGDDPSAPS